MTLSEIRDDIVRRLERECTLRGLPKIKIANKGIAMDISEAQQDIQRRLAVIEDSTTITTVSGTSEYNLPSNFGSIKSVTIANVPLKQVLASDIYNYPASSSEPIEYSLLISGNTQKIQFYPTPNAELSVVVKFNVDSNFYSPSGASSQDWGTFDGSAFSGNLLLPERYTLALEYYVLSLYLPDYVAKYERELNSLRESQVTSVRPLKYKIAGI